MFRSGISRAIASACIAVSALVGVGGLVVAGAAPAGAQDGDCNPAPLVCIHPSAAIVNKQLIKVIVKASPNEEIAVTECNAGLAGGDSNACNSNPSDLGRAGGPALALTNSVGRAHLEYKVLVSTTRPVGDGNCLPGGDSSGVPCFLIAADVSTQQPIANPVPFTTQ